MLAQVALNPSAAEPRLELLWSPACKTLKAKAEFEDVCGKSLCKVCLREGEDFVPGRWAGWTRFISLRCGNVPVQALRLCLALPPPSARALLSVSWGGWEQLWAEFPKKTPQEQWGEKIQLEKTSSLLRAPEPTDCSPLGCWKRLSRAMCCVPFVARSQHRLWAVELATVCSYPPSSPPPCKGSTSSLAACHFSADV